MKVAITCTQPRCDDIASYLCAYNIDAYAMPALEVQVLDGPKPAGDFDAMLVTSRHAITDTMPNIPVIAVGAYTAKLLNEKGYNVVQTGTGGVNDLNLSHYQSILYPCAAEPSNVPDNAKPWPVYETKPNPDFEIDENTDIVAVFSVKGAHQLNQTECKASTIICLSQTVANALTGIDIDRLAVCVKPSYDELEKLIIEACKS